MPTWLLFVQHLNFKYWLLLVQHLKLKFTFKIDTYVKLEVLGALRAPTSCCIPIGLLWALKSYDRRIERACMHIRWCKNVTHLIAPICLEYLGAYCIC